MSFFILLSIMLISFIFGIVMQTNSAFILSSDENYPKYRALEKRGDQRFFQIKNYLRIQSDYNAFLPLINVSICYVAYNIMHVRQMLYIELPLIALFAIGILLSICLEVKTRKVLKTVTFK